MNIVRVSKVEQVCHCIFADDSDKQLNYISRKNFLFTNLYEEEKRKRDRSIGSSTTAVFSLNNWQMSPMPNEQSLHYLIEFMCMCVLLRSNIHNSHINRIKKTD